jgi:hypothetical protein
MSIPISESRNGVSLDAQKSAFNDGFIWIHREDGAVLDEDIHFFHSRSPNADS